MKATEEQKERMRNYYKKNREKMLYKSKEYSYKNKDKISIRRRSQREKWRKWDREYYKKNKERLKIKKRIESKKLYWKYKDKKDQKNKEYYLKNKKNYFERQKEYRKLPRVRIINRIRESTQYHFPLKDKICQICKNSKATSHHHYTNPYEYNKFVYVCLKCHQKLDNDLLEVDYASLER